MKNFRYFLSLVPGILALTGNILGGNFIFLNLFYNFVGLVVLDHLMKEDKEAPDENSSAAIPNLILLLSSLIHTGAIITLLYGVYTQKIAGFYIALAIFSTGLNSGISGIISAHEMIHRKQNAWQLLGIWNLVLVNYGHFYIEHIKGHHKWVGTAKDPATARFGESIYKFFLRTIPGQFNSALFIEMSRLEKVGKGKFSFRNFVIRVIAFQTFVCGFIYSMWGAKLLLMYLLQSLVAVLLLEYVNYIEHYGLVRDENEKYNATHAWQSDIVISRFTLIELSRHSDHHLKASKPYHLLLSHETSPVLPSGYFGVFYFVLIPPLWYKLVHPELEKMKAAN